MQGTRGPTLSAMHMLDGLILNHHSAPRISDILSAWDKGCTELYYELAQYGELADRLFQATYSKELNAPGVYDYEVSEEFGAWFGTYILEHGNAPSPTEAEAKFRELDEIFWNQVKSGGY